MAINYIKKKFINLSKISLCVALLIVGVFYINKVMAVNASMVKVNGIFCP